jgi:linoleate 8R-lipoxygenase/9,12-octadecadienoate 8-hydroperoxide 8R-isomerase
VHLYFNPTTFVLHAISTMSEKQTGSANGGLGKTLAQLEQLVSASLRPLPSQTGDGTYVTEQVKTGILKDLPHVDLGDLKTLVDVSKSALTGEALDDRKYIMERVVQLAAGLPSTSQIGKELTNTFLTTLWNDLEHPPISYLGRDAMYRRADGSGNVGLNDVWR